MEKWEYQTIKVEFEVINAYKSLFKSDVRDWVVKNSDGSQIVGFENIFNGYGKNGWELVNVVVENTVGDLAVSAERYRLFFKRRLL